MPDDIRSSGCGSTGDGRRGRQANLQFTSERYQRKKGALELAVRQGREVSRFRQSPMAWLAAPSGLSFSKKSVKSPTNAMIATTADHAKRMKNNASKNSTRKFSRIWVTQLLP